MSNSDSAPRAVSAGRAWIDGYLLPHLQRRFPGAERLACLQLAPDDATEAERLRELGHTCEMVDITEKPLLAAADASYDFIFTGRFPLLARDFETRVLLAGELFRVLRKGGSLLLALGNRFCPLDLSRNGGLIHGPRATTCLSLSEANEILVKQARFTALVPLQVAGHFGWNSLPAPIRPLGRVLDFFWRHVTTPSRRWLYGSPLNPTLLLWLNKDSL